MLQETMGCPQTFEFRREELRELRSGENDEEVVASFLDLVLPLDLQRLPFLSAHSLLPLCLLSYRCSKQVSVALRRSVAPLPEGGQGGPAARGPPLCPRSSAGR